MRRLLLISTVALLLSALFEPTLLARDEDAGPRSLTGIVTGKDDRPVADALVSLENTRSLAVGTFITGPDGVYRFNNLSRDIDYEVHAESQGRRSQTKTLSSFDSRKEAHINLKLEK